MIEFVSAIARKPRTDNLLFTINGQSNAKGFETGPPSQSRLNGVIPRVLIWTGSSFDPLEYGVNNEGQNGHGIELNLGYLASKITTGNIYIVKHASNSSALGDEAATQNDWSPTGDLFPQFVTKFNDATTHLMSNSISYNFIANWWDQGERDSNDAALYNSYGVNLNNLETRIRTELNNVPTSMRFITVRLSSQITRTFLDEVRRFQMDKVFVNNDDLVLQGDNIHHTSESQNIMAARFLLKAI